MKDVRRPIELARAIGFTHAAAMDPATLRLHPEVRDMCRANTCGVYGRNWGCPPGCGEIEALQTQIGRYHSGLIVQLVGELEDEFDGEGMMAAEARFRSCFCTLHDRLRAEMPRTLALGAGACRRCETCTCPDAPCRFPEKRTSSMEAWGILVLEACRDNGLGYYYGRRSIAYTGCFLFD